MHLYSLMELAFTFYTITINIFEQVFIRYNIIIFYTATFKNQMHLLYSEYIASRKSTIIKLLKSIVVIEYITFAHFSPNIFKEINIIYIALII